MKLKKCANYRMDFNMSWLNISAFMSGVSFFLIVVHYFLLGHYDGIKGGEMFFSVILPLLLLFVYMVTLRGFSLNAPGLYAILGCIYCLLAIIWSFDSGSVLRIVLALIWYAFCAAVLLGTVAGLIPLKWIGAAAFAVPSVYRLFLVDWKTILVPEDFVVFLPDVAVLAGLCAFAFFFIGLKPLPLRRDSSEK